MLNDLRCVPGAHAQSMFMQIYVHTLDIPGTVCINLIP